ncbi:MAG: hypothetical protein UV41_C0006G0003 [Candidatus Daviesbacteria bacterium GW2011_GWA2_42_7]|nr:MAG: hypothetical protein UV41_C0006G0003 [Candidatus Daviesbacteria bacterium GW2011_GWA2_42_7]
MQELTDFWRASSIIGYTLIIFMALTELVLRKRGKRSLIILLKSEFIVLVYIILARLAIGDWFMGIVVVFLALLYFGEINKLSKKVNKED